MIRVTVWNENVHETNEENIRKIYPEGIHGQIASFLKSDDIFVRTATLEQPEHGLSQEVIDDTDVLIWWSHSSWKKVSDEVVERVCDAVLRGMGFIALHSAHVSKPFKKLMGTSCYLLWRDDDRERLWCCNPTHPIAKGLPPQFDLPQEEMYGEFFDIPKPDDVIFMGWFAGGEVFRSVCTFSRGYGKIVYIQPGHEAYPIYYNENIQKLIKNSVEFAAPQKKIDELLCPEFKSLEK